MRSLRPLSTILALLPSISCGQPDPRDASFPLASVATSEAPLSEIPYVTLVTEDIACVIESFEVRVHCIHRSGTEVGVFGRPGEGPGEFRTPLFLVRGPDETLGVVDIALNRMSIFEPTGELTSQVRLPGTAFTPAARSFSSTLVGTWFQRGSSDRGLASWQGELDIASEEVLWERVYPNGLRMDAGCEPTRIEGLTEGVASRDRSFAFPACNGHLILFRDRDDPQGTLFQAVTYAPELPNAWKWRTTARHKGVPLGQAGSSRPNPMTTTRARPSHTAG